MTQVGRNDPCPCGSGKKYKRCCIDHDSIEILNTPTAMETAGTPNAATAFLNQFKSATEETQFESMDQLRGALNSFGGDQNTTPVLDFLGLNPDQMFELRRKPITELPQIAKVRIDGAESRFTYAPIVVATIALLGSIANEGRLKMTATGNLPQRVVRELHSDLGPLFFCDRPVPHSELSLPDLFLIRHLLMYSELIEERGSYLSVTGLGIEFLDSFMTDKLGGRLYRHLFLRCVNEFNWLFGTDYENEIENIQHAALFCFYILHKKARDYVDSRDLATYFTRAFPALAAEMRRRRPSLNEKRATMITESAFEYIFLDRICFYFGFLKHRQPDPDDKQPMSSPSAVRTSELFDLVFHCST